MNKLFLVLLFIGVCTAQDNSAALDLARSERNFSAASDTFGIKESFLRFLSDDCVMFNPHPANGKEIYRKRPENKANLVWHPTFVQVSSSGDFGLSTGPWQYSRSKGDTPTAYGHYFSVWAKQQDGSWKVIFDNGIDYPAASRRKERENIGKISGKKGKPISPKEAQTMLLMKEKELGIGMKSEGIARSYSVNSAADLRVYREGNFPTARKEESVQLLVSLPQQSYFPPIDVKVAPSGDLGFVYGYSVDAKNDSSTYMRVWRYEEGWKLAVDMLAVFPKRQ